MRLILPIIFILFFYVQRKYPKYSNVYYKLCLFIYLIFLSFRYLQGTDYIQYLNYYNLERPLHEVIYMGFYNTNLEFLYNLLSSIFRSLNLSFFYFIIFINIFVIVLFNRFFYYFSTNKLISLIILYLLYGIVFIESALRQSIAIAIILGICLVAYKKQNLKGLILGSLIAFFFHKSSILISLIIITWFLISNYYNDNVIKKFFKKNKMKFLFIFTVIFFIINFMPVEIVFSKLFGEPTYGGIIYKINYYFLDRKMSIFSIAIRLFYLLITIYIYKYKKIDCLCKESFLYFFYLMSFILYFLFIRIPIMSRITVYFEILEIVIFVDLFSSLLTNRKTFNKLVIICYCFLAIVLFIKDGYFTQIQSNYKNINLVYPYYSYFDMEKAINNVDF